MARNARIDRAQVVAAAAQLADAHGLDQLTLAQVAAQLRVRLPSLYNHIDGLPGLHRELARRGVRQLLERMSRAAIGKSEDDAVLAIAHAYRAYVLEHPGVYAASVRAPAPDDAELLALSQELITVVLAVLAPYRLSEEGAIHAVRGLRSVAHGFATLESAGGFGMALDREASFRLLVQALIAGLRAYVST
mgnify:FL=1